MKLHTDAVAAYTKQEARSVRKHTWKGEATAKLRTAPKSNKHEGADEFNKDNRSGSMFVRFEELCAG